MEPTTGLTTRLRVVTGFMWFLVVLYCCSYMLMTINYGQMMYDHMNERGVTWTYVRYFWNSLGLFSVIAMIFLLTHMLYGIYYLVAFITTVAVAGLHGVFWGFNWADLLSDCANVPMCSFTLGNSNPDYSFIIHFCAVGVLALTNIAFVILTIYLRTRVEFANYLAIAADSRYNPMTTYLTPPGGFSTMPMWLGGTGGGMGATAYASKQIGQKANVSDSEYRPLGPNMVARAGVELE